MNLADEEVNLLPPSPTRSDVSGEGRDCTTVRLGVGVPSYKNTNVDRHRPGGLSLLTGRQGE